MTNIKINKPNHLKAIKVNRRDLGVVLKRVNELIDFFDSNNGKFIGEHKFALSFHSCYVDNCPLDFFIVNNQFLFRDKNADRNLQTKENFLFPSRVIFNAKILKPEWYVSKMVQEDAVKKDSNDKKVLVKEMVERRIPNETNEKEGCMMYPNRKAKRMKRYFQVRVRYQIAKRFLFFRWFKTIEENVSGIKSAIFQHEVDHSNGVDIYFGDGNDRDIKRDYIYG